MNFDHIGAEQFHSEYIQVLPANIFRADVNIAFKSEKCADRRGSDAMLPSTGFGNDELLAHSLSEKGLADAIINFVRLCD